MLTALRVSCGKSRGSFRFPWSSTDLVHTAHCGTDLVHTAHCGLFKILLDPVTTMTSPRSLKCNSVHKGRYISYTIKLPASNQVTRERTTIPGAALIREIWTPGKRGSPQWTASNSHVPGCPALQVVTSPHVYYVLFVTQHSFADKRELTIFLDIEIFTAVQQSQTSKWMA